MTDPKIPVTEDELHAYVDNELPAERRGDVEAWLAAHPDDAERVQSWRTMAEALHARYDQVANEPVPKRLALERLGEPARTRGYGPRAAPFAARAHQALRLGRFCPRARLDRAEAGRRPAVARPGRACLVPDVRE